MTHTYAKPGTFVVQLTLVDPMENLATISHAIKISSGRKRDIGPSSSMRAPLSVARAD